jgi:hypothetical protein
LLLTPSNQTQALPPQLPLLLLLLLLLLLVVLLQGHPALALLGWPLASQHHVSALIQHQMPRQTCIVPSGQLQQAHCRPMHCCAGHSSCTGCCRALQGCC